MKDFKDSKALSSIFILINRLKVFNLLILFILSTIILILEEQILRRPKVGVDGLY